MGKMAEEALNLTYDELVHYLRANHSVYMQVGDKTYYLTDVNSHAWRAQDAGELNEKGHFVDCSDLVATMSEFEGLPFADGKTMKEAFDGATFFASEKPEEA